MVRTGISVIRPFSGGGPAVVRRRSGGGPAVTQQQWGGDDDNYGVDADGSDYKDLNRTQGDFEVCDVDGHASDEGVDDGKQTLCSKSFLFVCYKLNPLKLDPDFKPSTSVLHESTTAIADFSYSIPVPSYSTAQSIDDLQWLRISPSFDCDISGALRISLPLSITVVYPRNAAGHEWSTVASFSSSTSNAILACFSSSFIDNNSVHLISLDQEQEIFG
ncbi:hypothetical protein LXL04_036706 [Taraxacum kok-saghyz]